MEGKINPKLWVIVMIAVAVIGCIGGIGAAIIGILPEVIENSSQPTPTLQRVQPTEATPNPTSFPTLVAVSTPRRSEVIAATNTAPPPPTKTPRPPATPRPAPTAVPTLALPFVDNFEFGLSPEWDVLLGEPFIKDGRLGSGTDSMRLSLNLYQTDCTLEFDREGYGQTIWQFTPNLRFVIEGPYSGAYNRWEVRREQEWTVQSEVLGFVQDGGYQFVILDNVYSIYLNGEQLSQIVYGQATPSPLLLTINRGYASDEPFVDNVEVRCP